MELTQPRPLGAEGGGGRKATHDFLSLCSPSSTHHPTSTTAPPPPQPQEIFLRTHDFLGRTLAQEDAAPKETPLPSSGERPIQLPQPMEHALPGGIGTYTISHIPCFTDKPPASKPETTASPPFTVVQASSTDRTDDNSNSCSYTNSGFTLWDEPPGKKGRTGKENVRLAPAAAPVRDSEASMGWWNAPERLAQSSSDNNHRSSFGSFSSYQPSGQKSNSFIDMIKSAKGGSNAEGELEDGETEFVLKKESPPAPGELRVKIDGKSSDQKANTPRSKHSATEQRRRSKINDRFQMLRELIPHSDQKRDRASFLLEVIDYIQLLQEKVTKHEGLYQGLRHEPTNVMPSRNGQRPGNNFADQSLPSTNGSNPTLFFAPKTDEENDSLTLGIPKSGHNHSDTDIRSGNPNKANAHPMGIGNNVFPFPVSLHPNLSAGARSGQKVAHVSNGVAAGFDHKPWTAEYATALNNKLKEEELTVEGGSISFSNVYSHGLLNTLTQALQSSGVDLSEASIAVKIELGKSGNPRAASASPFPKDTEAAASKVQSLQRTRGGAEDSEQALKKLKTCKLQV
ncbi:hypothetical protein MLD38_028021 [Melastoma candidum]|uniref:Uncharacterized protein n=1 Tax=Melastoma candidum TaxID=119954 RepID=A0ACB9N5T6_9MYRT|nr:hypothetical protein MLD38_028021 [Melastoma candidum]